MDDLNTAIRSAQAQKKSAEEAVSAEAEIAGKKRSVKLSGNTTPRRSRSMTLCAYLPHGSARQMLDRAEALLSAQERVPVQQLRSLFNHGQTYARFVMGLIDRWVRTREGGNQWPAKSTA